jgi:hypothetical protein
LPPSFFTASASGTITAPSIAALSYTVNTTTATRTFTSFTYSISCTDIVWSFSAKLSDGSALPSFITLVTTANGVTNGGYFNVYTTNNASAGTYNIVLTATLE